MFFAGIVDTGKNIGEGRDKWPVGRTLPAACMARAVQDAHATLGHPQLQYLYFSHKEFSRHN